MHKHQKHDSDEEVCRKDNKEVSQMFSVVTESRKRGERSTKVIQSTSTRNISDDEYEDESDDESEEENNRDSKQSVSDEDEELGQNEKITSTSDEDGSRIPTRPSPKHTRHRGKNVVEHTRKTKTNPTERTERYSSPTLAEGKQRLPRGRKNKYKQKKKDRERQQHVLTSDNSYSPDPDLLTNSEARALARMFKCVFGRLFGMIKEPVEIAVQLQAENLLSTSTMEYLLQS